MKMKHLIAFLLICSAAVVTAAGFSMDQYRDKNRPLLVFAPDNKYPAYQATREAVAAARDGFERRDMLLISVFRNTGAAGSIYLSNNDATTLRDRYNVSPQDFRVLLIGKDGTVKLESAEVADMDEIFTLIDGMPMRQREMRESR